MDVHDHLCSCSYSCSYSCSCSDSCYYVSVFAPFFVCAFIQLASYVGQREVPALITSLFVSQTVCGEPHQKENHFIANSEGGSQPRTLLSSHNHLLCERFRPSQRSLINGNMPLVYLLHAKHQFQYVIWHMMLPPPPPPSPPFPLCPPLFCESGGKIVLVVSLESVAIAVVVEALQE